MPSRFEVQKLAEYTGHKGPIYSLLPSYRPGHFLSCASEGVVAEWSIASGDAVAVAQSPGPIFSMCLIPERNLLLLGLESGDLLFTDIQKKTTLRRVQLHKKAIFDLLPLPDGNTVLVSAGDGALSLWNLDQLDHIHYQKVSSSSVRTLALQPKTGDILAGASDNRIRIFDPGLELKKDWTAHKLSVFRIAFSADGQTLFSAGRDAHLSSWDVSNDYQMLHSVPAHMYTVNDIVFSNGLEKQYLFTGSMDKSIRMWDPDSLKSLKTCNFENDLCHWNGVNRLLWLDGNVISAGDDRKIMRWRFERKKA